MTFKGRTVRNNSTSSKQEIAGKFNSNKERRRALNRRSADRLPSTNRKLFHKKEQNTHSQNIQIYLIT